MRCCVSSVTQSFHLNQLNMRVLAQIVKEVVNTEDSQLLQEVLAFLQQHQQEREQDPNHPRRGSYEALTQYADTLSKEDADEMTDIINREFNN